MVLWVFPLVISLIGVHVPYGCRLEEMLWKTWNNLGLVTSPRA